MLDRLVTTRYPLALVFIELAWQCAKRRVAILADWLPRHENEDADDLWQARQVDPAKRIVDLEDLRFGILDWLLAPGEAYHAEIEEAKASAKAERVAGTNRVAQRKKKLNGQSLKDRNP